MALDLWFREDVARILASTQETMGNSLGAIPPLDPQAADLYHQGFADALRAVAVAFGLRPLNVPVGPRWGQAPRFQSREIVDADPSRPGTPQEAGNH